MWVPAGLLEDGNELEIVAHVCVASRASWDSIARQGISYDDLPDLAEFVALLHVADA
jgi:hypothetical protein